LASGAALIALAVLGLLAVGPGSAGAVEGAAEFFIHTGRGTSVSCAIYDGYTDRAEALCERVTPRYQSKATLRPDGSVVLCRTHSLLSNRCELGNAGEPSPTYRPGKKVTVGRFTCTVIAGGARCTVTATGQGFVLAGRRLHAVGGASVRRR
jgi:hypothetical protein